MGFFDRKKIGFLRVIERFQRRRTGFIDRGEEGLGIFFVDLGLLSF